MEPDCQNNLWEPVPGDHRAHGDFDRRATNFSPQFWATTHQRSLTATAGGLIGLTCLYVFKKR